MVEPPPPPARTTIKGMMSDRVALYRHVPPPVRTIPVEVTPFLVEDSIPEEAEVAESVKRLWLNHSGVPLVMRAENLRKWLREAMREKEPDSTNWDKVVTLVQVEFWKVPLSKLCS